MKYLDYEDEIWSDEGLFCPHCKKEQGELQEISGAYEDGESETSCDSCGTEFEFSVYVSYSWTSPKIVSIVSMNDGC